MLPALFNSREKPVEQLGPFALPAYWGKIGAGSGEFCPRDRRRRYKTMPSL
jgi:hypothetical protein